MNCEFSELFDRNGSGLVDTLNRTRKQVGIASPFCFTIKKSPYVLHFFQSMYVVEHKTCWSNTVDCIPHTFTLEMLYAIKYLQMTSLDDFNQGLKVYQAFHKERMDLDTQIRLLELERDALKEQLALTQMEMESDEEVILLKPPFK
jgi:hypothetical protein